MNWKPEEITMDYWQLLDEKSKQSGKPKAQLITEAINAFFELSPHRMKNVSGCRKPDKTS